MNFDVGVTERWFDETIQRPLHLPPRLYIKLGLKQPLCSEPDYIVFSHTHGRSITAKAVWVFYLATVSSNCDCCASLAACIYLSARGSAVQMTAYQKREY
jgi:hypothetical protein